MTTSIELEQKESTLNRKYSIIFLNLFAIDYSSSQIFLFAGEKNSLVHPEMDFWRIIPYDFCSWRILQFSTLALFQR